MNYLSNYILNKEQSNPITISYLYMILSGLFSHGFNFCFKLLNHLNIYQIIILNAISQLLFNQLYQLRSPQRFDPLPNIRHLIIRCIVGSFGILCIQIAIKNLMITEFYSILYMNPVLILIVSRLVYNEKLTYFDYLGMLLCVVGAILVVKPPFIFTFLNIEPTQDPDPQTNKYYGYLCSFGVLVAYTYIIFLIKMIPKQISEYQILNYVSLSFMFTASFGQLINGQQMQLRYYEYSVLLISGLCGAGFQNFQAKSIRLGPPGKLMIMRYLGLFYGFLTDIFYFQKTMDYFTIFGAFCIFLVAVIMFLKNAYLEKQTEVSSDSQQKQLSSIQN